MAADFHSPPCTATVYRPSPMTADASELHHHDLTQGLTIMSRFRSPRLAKASFSVAVTVAAWLLPVPASLGAQAAALQTTITPDTLVVPRRGEGTAFLTLRNGGSKRLRQLRISWLTSNLFQARSEPAAMNTLAPGARAVVVLRVAARGRMDSEGALLRIDYRRSNGRRETAFAQVRLRPEAPISAASIADVEVLSQLNNLTDVDSATVYLKVQSKTVVPLSVGPVVARGPVFLSFVVDSARAIVEPGASAVLEIGVHADGWVRPGKHPLVFDVPVRVPTAGDTTTFNLTTSRELEVGVLGESELLKLLSVPSFLVLPGFLVLLTLGILLKYSALAPRLGERGFPPQPTTSEFWLIAVTLSIITAVGYPLAGGRNYLRGYGLSDVAKVWGVSIGIGVLVFAVILGIVSFVRQWYRPRRIPNRQDEPLEVMKKLDRQKLNTSRERVKFTQGGADQTGYALQLYPSRGTSIWLGPTVAIRWNDAATPETLREFEELSQARDPGKLAIFLEKAKIRGAVQVRWKPMGTLDGPVEVQRSWITEVQTTPGPWIEVD